MLLNDFLDDHALNLQTLLRHLNLFMSLLLHQEHSSLACAECVSDDQSMAVLPQGILSFRQQQSLVRLQLLTSGNMFRTFTVDHRDVAP